MKKKYAKQNRNFSTFTPLLSIITKLCPKVRNDSDIITQLCRKVRNDSDIITQLCPKVGNHSLIVEEPGVISRPFFLRVTMKVMMLSGLIFPYASLIFRKGL